MTAQACNEPASCGDLTSQLSFCAHDRYAQSGRIGIVAAARAVCQRDKRVRIERAAAIGADHNLVAIA
jgi:hypothetical protein